MRPQRADQGLLAELVEDRDDAVPQAHDSVQLYLHVLELQFWIAHRVLKEGHEVALEFEILDDCTCSPRRPACRQAHRNRSRLREWWMKASTPARPCSRAASSSIGRYCGCRRSARHCE